MVSLLPHLSELVLSLTVVALAFWNIRLHRRVRRLEGFNRNQFQVAWEAYRRWKMRHP